MSLGYGVFNFKNIKKNTPQLPKVSFILVLMLLSIHDGVGDVGASRM